MPAVENDLGINHSEAGSLFLLISLGYFVSLLCSGFVSSRLMHRKTIILSSLALGTALIAVSLVKDLPGLRIGLIILGLAAGLYIPSGIATLTGLVDIRHWGKALAIHELAPNLSFIAAPLISEALLSWFGWRSVMLTVGLLSLLAGFAFARFNKGGDFPGRTPGFMSFKILFREPGFWIMMTLFSFGIAGTLGLFTMLPLFLVSEHGISRNWANSLISFSRVSGLAMAFVAGWASDRFGVKRTISVVLLLTGISTILLGSLKAPWIIPLIFIQPLMAVCFFPPGIAALSHIGPAEARNVSVSLTVPVSFVIGGGAIPILIGAMGDAGSFGLGIVFTGGLMVLGSFLVLALPSRSK